MGTVKWGPSGQRTGGRTVARDKQTELAALRFGLGARSGELTAAAADPRAWLLAQVNGAVPLAGTEPLAASPEIYAALLAAREERREMKADGTPALSAVRTAYQPHYRAQVLARAQSAALTQRPFAERRVHFWSNHFAISADKGVVYGLAGTLENEAIRPRLNGRFADLLIAVEQHPAMIAFLDNQSSTGTQSPAAQFAARRASQRRLTANGGQARRPGINENPAREILELHTLGVNGGYNQADVTSFAHVLTGWSIGGARGRFGGGVTGRFFFREGLHEPGVKTVLGRSYRERTCARERRCSRISPVIRPPPASLPPSSRATSLPAIRPRRRWPACSGPTWSRTATCRGSTPPWSIRRKRG